jgi:NADPH2:quinone reductase
MKAIGATRSLPVTDPDCLIDFETPDPVPGPRDLLVRIEAVAVNPVDTKVRAKLGSSPVDPPRILGFDAAGTVEAIGPKVTSFKPGDTVYHSGDLSRPGCNAELHLVDERLVARRPSSLDASQAASLPLTMLTAWELLFERMSIDPDGGHAGSPILVIGGGGGMGSAVIQLAKLAGLKVIATASRPATTEQCRSLGADHVIDHRQPLPPQAGKLGFGQLPFIANLVDTSGYWKQTAELLAPLGALGLIVEPTKPVHIGDPLKAKCARICWEFMAARPMYRLHDMHRHGEILAEIARFVDAGTLRPSIGRTIAPLDAANLRDAHAEMEAGTAVGKTVLCWQQ